MKTFRQLVLSLGAIVFVARCEVGSAGMDQDTGVSVGGDVVRFDSGGMGEDTLVNDCGSPDVGPLDDGQIVTTPDSSTNTDEEMADGGMRDVGDGQDSGGTLPTCRELTPLCDGGSCADRTGTAELNAKSAVVSKGGTYVVHGISDVYNHGTNEMWVARINTDLTVDWAETVGPASPSWPSYSFVFAMSDGGSMLAGHIPGGFMFLTRLDQFGEPLWAKQYQKILPETMVKAPGIGFVVASEGDASDFIVTAIDENGAVPWAWQLVDTSGKNHVLPRGVTLTSDGDVVAVGDYVGCGETSCYNYAVVLRLEPSGIIKWQHVYFPGEFIAVTTIDGGGIAVAGIAHHYDDVGISDAWVVRINPAGDIEWQRTYGASGSGMASQILADSSETIVVADIADVATWPVLVSMSGDGSPRAYHSMRNTYVQSLDMAPPDSLLVLSQWYDRIELIQRNGWNDPSVIPVSQTSSGIQSVPDLSSNPYMIDAQSINLKGRPVTIVSGPCTPF